MFKKVSASLCVASLLSMPLSCAYASTPLTSISSTPILSSTLFLSLASTLQASQEAQAQKWLLQNQQEDGGLYLSSDVTTSFQSTSAAIDALISHGVLSEEELAAAASFLNQFTPPLSTEYLALRILVKYRIGNGISGDVTELKVRMNPDGGFGAYPGYDSSVFDTALALKILAVANSTSSDLASSVAYLTEKQSLTGGWAINQQNDTSIETTALVLEALRFYAIRFNLKGPIQSGTNYLLAEQTESNWNTELTTAQALNALIPLSTDTSEYAIALQNLRAAQNPNGSWSNDVYITSLALRALNTPTVEIPDALSSANVNGLILDKSTGTPLSQVLISVSGPVNKQTTAISDGSFNLQLDKTGQYEITYSKEGYQSVIQGISLDSLDDFNLGSVQLVGAQDVLPNNVVLWGSVKDGATGAPLVGAKIAVQGAADAEVVADTNGQWRLETASPGLHIISFTKEGYQSVQTTFDAKLGNRYQISPSLYSVNDTVPSDIPVSALILDKTSNQPIEGASLSIAQNGTEVEVLSDSAGRVLIASIQPGEFTFKISAQGYQAVEGKYVASTGASIKMGNIALDKLLSESAVSGEIVDQTTGLHIPSAKVELTSSSQSFIVDSNGQYLLQGVKDLQFTLKFSAPGYLSRSVNVSLNSHQNADFSAQLEAISSQHTGLGISFLAPAEVDYGVYEKALINADFFSGESSETLQMVMEVKGPNGYFERFPAIHQEVSGDISDSILTVPAKSNDWRVQFEMMTGILSPGIYDILLQAYDMQSLQLKAERSASITISPVSQMTALQAGIQPKFSNYQAEEEVVLSATISNSSNVSYDSVIAYTFKSPDGTEITSGQMPVTVEPSQSILQIELERFTHLFEASGDYELVLTVPSGLGSSQTQNKIISVAPAVRVDPELSISPTEVTPDGDKTIRVNLKLTGRNQG